jgi:hypothetical protein
MNRAASAQWNRAVILSPRTRAKDLSFFSLALKKTKNVCACAA